MGAIVVAGWFVSIILNEMLERIKSQHRDPEKIVELRNSLTKIKPITDEVERCMLNGDTTFADYFNRIIEALYEAQDALGEHIYLAIQQDRLNQFVRKANYPYEGIKKFLKLDKHDRKMTRVINNLEKISASEVRATLDSSRIGSGRYFLEADAYFQPNNCTTRNLTIPDSEFRGRSGDVDLLVDDLTDPSCSDVVAIVGECGIGKTTLAQRVCGDPKIVEYFTDEGIVWIWAAPMDDKLEIAKQILKAVVSDRRLALGDQNNFDQLMKMLKEELTRRRILLVLDDVGINRPTDTGAHNFNLWNEVLDPFKGANSGSRVLVTTQCKNVAEVMQVREPIFLEGLPEEECRELFEKAAFQGREDEDPVLRAKGEKIIAKINGSPYLAKAAGEKLKGNTNRRAWEEILNDEKELYKGMVSHLKSRFKYLPQHLKRCFAFCSIFPKNWKFKRDSLVKMWISQAFIPGEETKAVDEGRKYFNELESWSFFQKSNDGTQYTIPHPMHYLAQSVSCYDCARIEGDKQENVPDTVRHLSLTTNNLPQLKKLGPQLKKLRTLLVIRNSNSPSSSNSNLSPAIIEEKVFSKLKRLRLLDLSGCDMTELPQSILKFMHLRYLALCETLTSLPEQMEKLPLKVLVIPKKCNLKKLPLSFPKIHTMEHLDMDREYFSFAPGIGEMTRLQSSVTFHAKKSKEGTNLIELKDLDNLLKELTIRNLENVTDKEGASQAQLSKKKDLEVLQLEWNSESENSVNVLNELEPPKELKTLHISGYAGPPSLPQWFDDQKRNLKDLYLTNCTRWEELPPLGNLPYLAILHLTRMPSLQQITHSFYGNVDEPFKYLKKLIFEEMLNLKSWASPSTNKTKFLPRLQNLRILNCPNLETVPVVPETVTKLRIKSTKFVRELNLSQPIYKEPSFSLDITNGNIVGEPYLSKKHLQYTGKLRIRNLNHATSEDFKIFVSLKTLHISESDITDELLTNCLVHLEHLSKLEINSCGNIKSPSIPKQVTPGDIELKHLTMLSSLASLENNVSIRRLTIQNCPILTAESFPTHFERLASLKILWISDCPKLKSLPTSFPSTLECIQLAACDPALSSNLKDDWIREGRSIFRKNYKILSSIAEKGARRDGAYSQDTASRRSYQYASPNVM